MRIEEQRRTELYEKKQKELFEKARIEMERNNTYEYDQSAWQSSHSSSSTYRGTKTTNNMSNIENSRRSFEYFANLEKSINDKARRMTVDYIKK